MFRAVRIIASHFGPADLLGRCWWRGRAAVTRPRRASTTRSETSQDDAAAPRAPRRMSASFLDGPEIRGPEPAGLAAARALVGADLWTQPAGAGTGDGDAQDTSAPAERWASAGAGGQDEFGRLGSERGDAGGDEEFRRLWSGKAGAKEGRSEGGGQDDFRRLGSSGEDETEELHPQLSVTVVRDPSPDAADAAARPVSVCTATLDGPPSPSPVRREAWVTSSREAEGPPPAQPAWTELEAAQGESAAPEPTTPGVRAEPPAVATMLEGTEAAAEPFAGTDAGEWWRPAERAQSPPPGPLPGPPEKPRVGGELEAPSREEARLAALYEVFARCTLQVQRRRRRRCSRRE
jgi:hypothetical protein